MSTFQIQSDMLINGLKAVGLEDCVDDIKSILNPIHQFSIVYNNQPVSFSKIGGNPYVPEDFVWPLNSGFPLQFLLQIQLSDLANFEEAANVLPKRGMVYIFWDERQSDNSFIDVIDGTPQEFTDAMNKLEPLFRRHDKKDVYKIIFTPEEDELYEASHDMFAKPYPFLALCSGLEYVPLIREEVFLTPTIAIHDCTSYFDQFVKTDIQKYRNGRAVLKTMERLYPRSNLQLFEKLFEETDFITYSNVDDNISINPDVWLSSFVLGPINTNTQRGDFSEVQFRFVAEDID